jgi:hypothetical protein
MPLAFHHPGRNLRNAAQVLLRVFVVLLALSISEKLLSAAQAPSTAAPQTTAQPSAQKPPAPKPPSPKSPSQKPPSKTSAKQGSKTMGKSHSSKHSRSAAKSRTRERAQRAPTPERISEIQSALAGAGHYSGTPTGKWDASTIQAVKHYQQANGLSPTASPGRHDSSLNSSLNSTPLISRRSSAPTEPLRPFSACLLFCSLIFSSFIFSLLFFLLRALRSGACPETARTVERVFSVLNLSFCFFLF